MATLTLVILVILEFPSAPVKILRTQEAAKISTVRNINQVPRFRPAIPVFALPGHAEKLLVLILRSE